MIEKSLMIVMTVYAISFSALTMQYVIGDVFGITITSWDGKEVRSEILDFIDEDNLNTIAENIITANFTENTTAFDRVIDSTIAAAFVGWELVTLLSGTYIFNLLYVLGIPPIFIAGMVILYIFLLGRTIVAYIRGV